MYNVNSFYAFWGSTPDTTRGAWNATDLGMGKAKRYRDSDIIILKEFVQEDELTLLVNLTQSCEGFFSVGPTGSRHDLTRIEDVMEREPYYRVQAHLHVLIGNVARDMWHLGARRSTNVALERRFMKSEPAPKKSENGLVSASQWLLFLNSDYQGGELFFPTRHVVVSPLSGTIVRWPSGIPHGIATTHEGYQFTLSGQSV